MATEKRTIYAIRDTRTGQLVYDITSKHRLYYTRFAYAENTIREHIFKSKIFIRPRNNINTFT